MALQTRSFVSVGERANVFPTTALLRVVNLHQFKASFHAVSFIVTTVSMTTSPPLCDLSVSIAAHVLCWLAEVTRHAHCGDLHYH